MQNRSVGFEGMRPKSKRLPGGPGSLCCVFGERGYFMGQPRMRPVRVSMVGVP